MADIPPAGAAGQPAVDPAPLSTEPPKTPEKTTEIPELDPQSTILLGDKEVPLGDMATAYEQLQVLQNQQQQTPQIDKEKFEEYELFNKAMSNDKEAIAALWQKYAPQAKQPDGQATVEEPDAKIQALQQQVQLLQQALGQVKPVTDGISQLAGLNQLKTMIDSNKEHFPHLAKHPEAATLVTAKLNEYDQMARLKGTSLEQTPPDFKQKALAMAFQAAENHIKNTISVFGGQVMEMEPKGKQIEAVDDQGQPEQKSLDEARVRANLTVDTEGNLIDRRTGKRVLGPQGTPVQPVASEPVQAVPQGHGVAPETAQPAEGVHSVKTMTDQMKGRLESL